MTRYAGVYVKNGCARTVEFEAASSEEAQQIAQLWGVGVTGEARETPAREPLPPPEAYDEVTAGTLLGGLSRSSLYRLVAVGKLDRVPHTRRFLVTRRSLERYCQS